MTGVSHLYIHLPFCSSRCGYCDFYSQAGGEGLMEAYVAAVLAELREVCALGGAREVADAGGARNREVTPTISKFSTVYLGGGTPTLLGGELIRRLLAGVRESAVLAKGAEITVEANPVTINEALAQQLLAAGVNRVSLGVQSFSPALRRNLERAGGVEAVESAVRILRTAGFQNMGLDMIFGIPGEAAAGLDSDIEAVLALEPEHISWYELTVKDGSPYQVRWAAELEAVEASGAGALFYRRMAEALEAAGYRWYETSNFARPGFECRHNLSYWRGDDYLGLGAGAWSTVGRRRWRNVEDAGAYIEAVMTGAVLARVQGTEMLSEADKMKEKLALGLRLDRGLARSQVSSIIDVDQERLLARSGFLNEDDERLSLTREGRFVANEVCARLLK